MSRLNGAVPDRFDDFPDIANAVTARGIHLNHVGMPIGHDADAIRANAAWIDSGTTQAIRTDAVQRSGDNTGGGGFADTAHTGEHEGMRHPAGGEGIAQNAHHRFLADEVVKGRRPVFAGEHAVGRGVHRLRDQGWCGGVAEQARPIVGRGRQFVLRGIVAKQAGHAVLPGRGGGDAFGVGGRHATRAETHRGCFLPDLTGVDEALVRRRPPGGCLARLGGVGARRGFWGLDVHRAYTHSLHIMLWNLIPPIWTVATSYAP